ncbi:hypothetical protein [Bacillus paranthracis]|uniref:hypothetical protein n=1 Tax=Bacillus paranthracis TaxID=2026186 RepID=UPI0021574F26|nr:hypothetical protein [Bacillus paranthracis]MCR6795658.1 hypothetical protein [Bacillus paranthracis]MED1166037.1 hypothetical protein [Bacillus paranthracis]
MKKLAEFKQAETWMQFIYDSKEEQMKHESKMWDDGFIMDGTYLKSFKEYGVKRVYTYIKYENLTGESEDINVPYRTVSMKDRN